MGSIDPGCVDPRSVFAVQEDLKSSRRRVVLHVSSAVLPPPPFSPSPLLLFLSSRPKPNQKKRGVGWGVQNQTKKNGVCGGGRDAALSSSLFFFQQRSNVFPEFVLFSTVEMNERDTHKLSTSHRYVVVVLVLFVAFVFVCACVGAAGGFGFSPLRRFRVCCLQGYDVVVLFVGSCFSSFSSFS